MPFDRPHAYTVQLCLSEIPESLASRFGDSTVQYSCISLNIKKKLFSYIYQKFSPLVYIAWMLCDYKLAMWGGAQVEDVPVLI